MGLLLGASVMTVCEVLDLLFYNGLAKAVKNNNNKHDHDDDERKRKQRLTTPPADKNPCRTRKADTKTYLGDYHDPNNAV